MDAIVEGPNAEYATESAFYLNLSFMKYKHNADPKQPEKSSSTTRRSCWQTVTSGNQSWQPLPGQMPHIGKSGHCEGPKELLYKRKTRRDIAGDCTCKPIVLIYALCLRIQGVYSYVTKHTFSSVRPKSHVGHSTQ